MDIVQRLIERAGEAKMLPTLTIDELEDILRSDDERDVTINQDGSIGINLNDWQQLLRDAAGEIERMRLMLQMAYCQKVGADAPHGLDCCDDYRDWLKTLMPNCEVSGLAPRKDDK